MTQATRERLFGWSHAFDDPVTFALVIAVASALAIAPVLIFVLGRLLGLSTERRSELWGRYRSWLVLSPVMAAPVLLGAAWTIAAVGLLSLLCYREFARATGLFRERAISAFVVLGIVAMTFAVLDHWYGFFVALTPLMVILIAAIGVLADRPQGYTQRVALGTLGLLLFGTCLGHLGYMANETDYRPAILMLLLCVEMNDIFAFIVGRSIGGRPLAPQTIQKKTLAGAAGALLLTTILTALIARELFAGTRLGHPVHGVALGLIISLAGQLGDLMLSSVKRDVGVKDLGVAIPGHGGLLDRFDSLILAAPAVYHYVGYFRGWGLDQPKYILTGQ